MNNPMRRHALQRFQGEFVVVDNCEFVDCVFEDCTLHVGGGDVTLDGCDLVRCVLSGCWHPEIKEMAARGEPVDVPDRTWRTGRC